MNEDTFLLIEDYVLGRMSAEERQKFELRLSAEQDLREQVNVMKKLQTGIRTAGREQLRKQVFPPRSIPFMIRLDKKWVLAMAAVLVLSVILVYNLVSPAKNEQLFQAYYVRVDSVDLATPRGESEDFIIKRQAMDEFRAGHYDSAMAVLNELETPDDESALIKGMILIELKKWDEAKKELKFALKGSNENAVTANWYLALVHIQTKDYEAARKSLNEVAGRPSSYQSDAVKLLGQLP